MSQNSAPIKPIRSLTSAVATVDRTCEVRGCLIPARVRHYRDNLVGHIVICSSCGRDDDPEVE